MKLLGSLGNNRTKVLLALVCLYEQRGRVTVREVADGAGLPLGTTHAHLLRLRDDGFVAWEPHSQGSLRPLMGQVRRVA